jgi:hypothetical protein
MRSQLTQESNLRRAKFIARKQHLSSRWGVQHKKTSMQRFTYSIAQGLEYLSISFENSSG